MEEYVAVKPWIDFQIEFMRPIKGDSKSLIEMDDAHELERQVRSIIATYQSTFMQEALLFDKIQIVGPVSNSDDLVSRIIKGLIEESGEIFSLIDSHDVFSKLKASSHYTEDFTVSLETLLDFGESAAKKQDRLWKTMREYDRKFPELQREADGSFKHRERKATPEEERKWHQDLGKMFRKLEKSLVEDLYPFNDFLTRLQALKLEYFDNALAMPLLSYASYTRSLPNSRRHDIAQLVIHNLPMPDGNTTWEQIVEYRENPDNRKDLLGLRRWIRKLSAENLSPAECTEELEWLEHEFQAHMRLHKIKANTATLEVMVKAPLEILENLLTLKFSKLVDPLFAIKKRQISLMEAEFNAPGREIAYLIKAKESFQK